MFRFISIVCVLGLAVLSAGCGLVATPLPLPFHRCQRPDRGRPAVPTAISPVSGPNASGSEAAVRAAVNDLAARLKVAPETVQVVSVAAADWSDTSLGCPQPGMFYAQIIVQGYKIVLSAGDAQTEYHADRKGRVVTCK